MSTDYDFLCKFIIVGDCHTGKTNIISQYTQKTFNKDIASTIGVEFISKIIQYSNVKLKLQIWDTAGMEKYRGITRAYYRGAVGCLLVYDVSNQNSFYSVQNWLKEIRHVSSDIKIILIGNKSDVTNREVSYEEGQQFATLNDILFEETSALHNTNIDTAFTKLIDKIPMTCIIAHPKAPVESNIEITLQLLPNDKRCSC